MMLRCVHHSILPVDLTCKYGITDYYISTAHHLSLSPLLAAILSLFLPYYTLLAKSLVPST